MPALTIIMDGDNCWEDLKGKDAKGDLTWLAGEAEPLEVAILDKGMASGKPSIAIRINLPDGKVIVAETSAALFCGAARAFIGKYPELLG